MNPYLIVIIFIVKCKVIQILDNPTSCKLGLNSNIKLACRLNSSKYTYKLTGMEALLNMEYHGYLGKSVSYLPPIYLDISMNHRFHLCLN